MIRTADEVAVIRGSGFDPKHRKATEKLAVEREPAALGHLIDLLATVKTDVIDAAFMEGPQISFAFLRERELLGEVGLLSSARWVRHEGDADLELANPAELVEWLHARHIEVHRESATVTGQKEHEGPRG